MVADSDDGNHNASIEAYDQPKNDALALDHPKSFGDEMGVFSPMSHFQIELLKGILLRNGIAQDKSEAKDVATGHNNISPDQQTGRQNQDKVSSISPLEVSEIL